LSHVTLSEDANRMNRVSAQIETALCQLARWHGVATGYVDMAKRRQSTPVESVLGVLRALGVPITRPDDAPEALRVARRAMADRVLEPVQVAWHGQRTWIPLRLPEGSGASMLRWEWHFEDGTERSGESRLDRLRVRGSRRSEGRRTITRLIPVPLGLPAGYHRLAVVCGPNRFKTEVFSAPETCWQGTNPRPAWGIFAPPYALHSERSWGGGDLGDLADFVTWVGEQGGRFIGILPLLAAFLENPCEPSPYSPVSRLFWNEFYLDLTRVPELQTNPAARRRLRSAPFQERLEALRQAPLVDYFAQMALKRNILETLSRSFFTRPSERRCAFDEFLREHPRVADYARFRAVHERRRVPWTEWPERMRAGELRDADSRQSSREYHLYVQWLAHEQMAELSRHALRQGVDLYLDMPLGTHHAGYDAWRYQELFAREASGGAPPDPVFTQGQDWGFAPVHPQRSREQGHAYVRAYLHHHLRHARMLRFDHVMGLHRLYWVPRDFPASQGAYVRYPAEEYYAMLSIASHRYRAHIIGENLGTVPDVVNRGLKRHGLGGMFVVQYEARPAPQRPWRRVPARVVASLNTHDMPPFAAYWSGSDLDDHCDLGHIPRAQLPAARRRREKLRRALLRLPGLRGERRRGEAAVADVVGAILEQLGLSPARWVLVNVEDLWLETASQNTPGTTTERVNWRRKMRYRLEVLREQRECLELLRALRRSRR
jgi:4-alpha-glucanotransferase